MSVSAPCAMAVMAKAPRPNHVKTRLMPPLSGAQAASLTVSFLRDITANIAEAGRALPIAGHVAYAPLGCEHLFHGVLADGTKLVLADGTMPAPAGVEGFGRVLFHAAVALLRQGYGAVCLVNSDSPTLPTDFLRQAATALAQPGDRMVLGPSDDGGYYLIGLKAPHAALFQHIAWSTDVVAAQTLERAAALVLETVMLPLWFDVDDIASLRRLAADLDRTDGEGAVPYAAPATRGWMLVEGDSVLGVTAPRDLARATIEG